VSDESDPGFPAAPPARIDLPGDRALVRVSGDRAAQAAEAINESLEHLAPWMGWASVPATEAGIATFLAAGEALWDERRDFGYSIVEGDADDRVVGGCGLHGRLGPHGLEIGYWVHVGRIGRGIATDAARALTDAAFAIDGIRRVRITCAEDNVRSARVPEKLGYRFLGVEVPSAGEHAGRPTQIWEVERANWSLPSPSHLGP
jgi:RimJ/RimL family protein N-acetyltransferase